ncbi:MAG: protein kinase [Candidatus Margulisiibacteriota bacterium]
MPIKELPRVARKIQPPVATRIKGLAWLAPAAPLSIRDRVSISTPAQKLKANPTLPRRNRGGFSPIEGLFRTAIGGVIGMAGVFLINPPTLSAALTILGGGILLALSTKLISKAVQFTAKTSLAVIKHPVTHVASAVTFGGLIALGWVAPLPIAALVISTIYLSARALFAKLNKRPATNSADRIDLPPPEVDHSVILRGADGDYKYDPADVIGEGGFARIYKGTKEDGIPVAIKIMIKPIEVSDAVKLRDRIESFLIEARVLEAAHAESTQRTGSPNPNIVGLVDKGTTDVMIGTYRQPFIVLEFLPGKTLKDYRIPNKIDKPTAANILFGILNGLRSFHNPKRNGFGGEADRGIVLHRDLTYGNIILVMSEDKIVGVKIIDPGVAKQVDEPRTGILDVIGTVKWLPPEESDVYDERSDLFQVGLLYYFARSGLLATEEMFAEAETPPELLAIRAHWKRENTMLPFERFVDEDEIHFLARACHPDPNKRYQSKAEMEKDLTRLFEGKSIPDYFALSGPQFDLTDLRSVKRYLSDINRALFSEETPLDARQLISINDSLSQIQTTYPTDRDVSRLITPIFDKISDLLEEV